MVEGETRVKNRLAFHGLDLDIDRSAQGHVLLEKGDFIFVGWIEPDDSGFNDPIRECDGSGVLTDGVEKYHLVGRYSDSEPDIDHIVPIVTRMFNLGDTGLEDLYDDQEERVVKKCKELWPRLRKIEPFCMPLSRNSYSGELSILDDSDYDRLMIDCVWQPDKCYLEHINSIPEAERHARWLKDLNAILDEYNKWVTGDVWGVRVVTFENGEEIEDESCWGCIGSEYALTELKGTFDAEVKRHTEIKNPTQQELFSHAA